MREPFSGGLCAKLRDWLSGRCAYFTVSLILSGCLDGSPIAPQRAQRAQSDRGEQSDQGQDIDREQGLPAELDSDLDGVPDRIDNCPATPNPAQRDGDTDGAGDLCDPSCFGEPRPCEASRGLTLDGETLSGVEGMNTPRPRSEVFIELEGQGLYAESDMQARYRLDEIPSGEHTIYLYLPRPMLPDAPRARRYDLERPDGAQQVALAQSRSLDLVAAPRAGLFGLLRLAGQPFNGHGGVGVFVVGRPGYHTLSAPDGSFEIDAIPLPLVGEPALSLQLRAPGYRPLAVPLSTLVPFTTQFLSVGGASPAFLLEEEPSSEPLTITGEVLLPQGARPSQGSLRWSAPLTGDEGEIALVDPAGEALGAMEKENELSDQAQRAAAASANLRVPKLSFSAELPAGLVFDLYLELEGYQRARRRQLFQRADEVVQVRFQPQSLWRRLPDGALIEDADGDGVDDEERAASVPLDRDRDGIPDVEEPGWERSPFGSGDDDEDGLADSYDAREGEGLLSRLEELLLGLIPGGGGDARSPCPTGRGGAHCAECLLAPLGEESVHPVCDAANRFREPTCADSPLVPEARRKFDCADDSCLPATCRELAAGGGNEGDALLRFDGIDEPVAAECLPRSEQPGAPLLDLLSPLTERALQDRCVDAMELESSCRCVNDAEGRCRFRRLISLAVEEQSPLPPLSELHGLRIRCTAEQPSDEALPLPKLSEASISATLELQAGARDAQRVRLDPVSLPLPLDFPIDRTEFIDFPLLFPCVYHGVRGVELSVSLQVSNGEDEPASLRCQLDEEAPLFLRAPLLGVESTCGDHIIDAGESCDEGGPTTRCDERCVDARGFVAVEGAELRFSFASAETDEGPAESYSFQQQLVYHGGALGLPERGFESPGSVDERQEIRVEVPAPPVELHLTAVPTQRGARLEGQRRVARFRRELRYRKFSFELNKDSPRLTLGAHLHLIGNFHGDEREELLLALSDEALESQHFMLFSPAEQGAAPVREPFDLSPLIQGGIPYQGGAPGDLNRDGLSELALLLITPTENPQEASGSRLNLYLGCEEERLADCFPERRDLSYFSPEKFWGTTAPIKIDFMEIPNAFALGGARPAIGSWSLPAGTVSFLDEFLVFVRGDLDEELLSSPNRISAPSTAEVGPGAVAGLGPDNHLLMQASLNGDGALQRFLLPVSPFSVLDIESCIELEGPCRGAREDSADLFLERLPGGGPPRALALSRTAEGAPVVEISRYREDLSLPPERVVCVDGAEGPFSGLNITTVAAVGALNERGRESLMIGVEERDGDGNRNDLLLLSDRIEGGAYQEELERVFRFPGELLELRRLGDWNGDGYLDLAALVKRPSAPESPVDTYELYFLFGAGAVE